MANKLLKDIVKTRAVLKEKLKNIKLNQIERDNLLEDTFQPITKPLKQLIGKLDDNKENVSTTVKASTDGLIQNHNDDDDNDTNISDYEEANTDIKSDTDYKPKNLKRTSSLNSNFNSKKVKVNVNNEIKSKHLKSKEIKSKSYDKDVFHKTMLSTNASANVFHNTILPSYIDDNAIEEICSKRTTEVNKSNINNKRAKPDKSLKRKSKPQLINSTKQIRIQQNLKRKKDTPRNIDDDDGDYDKKRIKTTHIFSKRKSTTQLNNDTKRVRIQKKNLKRMKNYFDDDDDYKKRKKTTHIFSKRKSETQLNSDRKRVKLNNNNNNDANINSDKSSLFKNVQLLMNNDMLDKVYGFNVDQNGSWRYGNNELKFNSDNTIHIGNTKWKMTPGLFKLLFHSKPQHYTKDDLKNYKEILISTNAHKRYYQSKGQIKGTKAFKYMRIIKQLFNTRSNLLTKGSGLLLKSFDKRKPNYIYWNEPNELVDRLRLLVSSESAGHNNHKNEIISIVEELREANIIK